MADEPDWVSIKAVAWVLDEAPVPTELLPTLIAIARRAGPGGRGARTFVSTVARNTGKSADQTQRDITRLRALGLLVLGDQTEVAHLPSGRRPVVYDLPLHVRGPKPSRSSKNKSGSSDRPTGMDATTRMHAPTGMDAGGTTGMDAVPPTGMDAGQNKTLKNPGKNPSSSSGHESTTDYIKRRLQIDDDDASWIIQRIKILYQPRSVGAYIRSMSDDNLYELLAQHIVDDDRAKRAAQQDTEQAIEADRLRFARSLGGEPPCEHGKPGGHMPHPLTGWVACPHWRRHRREVGIGGP